MARTLNDLLSISTGRTLAILKHSNRCPTSSNIYNWWQQQPEDDSFAKEVIVIQDQRELSNEIAKVLNVAHQSPQVIVIRDGKLVGSASHMSIKIKLRELVSKAG